MAFRTDWGFPNSLWLSQQLVVFQPIVAFFNRLWLSGNIVSFRIVCVLCNGATNKDPGVVLPIRNEIGRITFEYLLVKRQSDTGNLHRGVSREGPAYAVLIMAAVCWWQAGAPPTA